MLIGTKIKMVMIMDADEVLVEVFHKAKQEEIGMVIGIMAGMEHHLVTIKAEVVLVLEMEILQNLVVFTIVMGEIVLILTLLE